MTSSSLNPGGNPQGKGTVPVLEAINSLRAWQPQEKTPEQILREFCLSTLVLSARFDFRVVPGREYWLYRVDNQWRLSLIAPEEWGSRQPGPWVARCELAHDMTWDLALAPDVAEDQALVTALEQHLRGFIDRIDGSERLEQALPVYEQGLPYQQRMMATALASSLQTSIIMSGLSNAPGKQWLGSNLRQILLPTVP